MFKTKVRYNGCTNLQITPRIKCDLTVKDILFRFL
jgi:hypothetical protein